MSKLLFWVVTILVVLVAMRLLARASAAKQRRRTHPTDTRRAVPRRYADMVQCAHCQVHLPKSDALYQLGDYWCSDEHARLGRER